MIHPKALVDDLSVIGSDTNVWAFAHVMSGASVGSHCNIGDHVFVESGATVGNNVTLKNLVMVWDGITIEDNVFVGPGVVFTNDRFPRSPRMPEAAGRYQHKSDWLVPTRVECGASLGAGSILCPGVVIGRYATVAAGSVVTKDVPPHAMVMGSPAQVVGRVCRCGRRVDAISGEPICSACQ